MKHSKKPKHTVSGNIVLAVVKKVKDDRVIFDINGLTAAYFIHGENFNPHKFFKHGEMIEVTIIKQCNYKQNAMGLFYIVSPEFLPIDLYIMEHQVGSMVEGIIFSIQGPLMTLMLDDNVFCTTKRSRHARTGSIVRCKIDKYNAKQRYIAVRVFE